MTVGTRSAAKCATSRGLRLPGTKLSTRWPRPMIRRRPSIPTRWSPRCAPTGRPGRAITMRRRVLRHLPRLLVLPMLLPCPRRRARLPW